MGGRPNNTLDSFHENRPGQRGLREAASALPLIAPELARAQQYDNDPSPCPLVGDWCPILYPAEARREVAPELVADSEATDNRAVGDVTIYGDDIC
jgi:hypothetical protein